jgi:hypothetical protein
MIRDLTTRFPLDAVELDGPYFVDAIDEFSDDFYPTGTWLASSCFCESCRQAGNQDGTDMGAAARSARVHLERYFEGQPLPHANADFETAEEQINAFLDTDPILKMFADWRSRQITTLIEQITKACETKFVLDDFFGSPFYGVDPKSLAAHCDAIMDSCDTALNSAGPSGPDSESAVADILNTIKEKWGIDKGQIEVGIPCALLETRDPTAIVSATHAAVKQGIRSVFFEDYADIMLHRLDWIHQAVRYAMREVQ